MCINTGLFSRFFAVNKDKNFMDFLIYTNVFKSNNMVVDNNIDITADTDIKIICNGITFKKAVRFQNCNFKGKVSFKNCIFENGVYFNNSIFFNYTDFHECRFYKDACFYGAAFKEAPNFSACQFKEPKAVNLINVDVSSLDFRKVESFIENNFNDEQCKKEIEQDSTDQPIIEQKYKLKYAKNIKDSFRTIKDVLIAQNNTLDAQEWHKLELYAKEKEIEFSLKNLLKLQYNQSTNKKIKLQKVKLNKESFKIVLNKIRRKKQIKHNSSIKNNAFFKEMILLPISISVYSLLYILYSLIFVNDSKEAINRFIKYQTIKSNRSFKNMLNMTSWMNCVLLQIYRNTSDHHTNITKILNWTICMIAVYMIFYWVLFRSKGLVEYSYLTLVIANFILFVIFVLLLLFLDNEKNNFLQHSFSNIVFIFIVPIAIAGITGFIAHQFFFFILYLVAIIVCYYLFICKFNIIILAVRLLCYTIFILTMILKPQLINPFIGIFSSDKLFESRLEVKLNMLNPNTITNLSKISQKEFISQNEYLTKHDISLTEASEAKKIVIANKTELNNIVSYLFDSDKKIGYFQEILVILKNNPSNLIDTIKNIDNKEKNNAMFYDMKKLLNSDFIRTNDSINYDVYKTFSAMSITLKDEDYQSFALQENQTKLKNILSLINLDKTLHLQEIKQTIDCDIIMNGTIKSTSIIYSIILLLCIFSLQKTARKNSIIPS